MKTVPDIIIFKTLEVEDGDPIFVELPYSKDGLSDKGFKFQVAKDDSYYDMKDSNIVLAKKDGDNSICLQQYELMKGPDHTLSRVFDIGFDELSKVVNDLVDSYLRET